MDILTIFALLAILFGILVIIIKNPISSIFFLIGLFASISVYLIISGLNFIGFSYLIVYIGAVSILFLFILMLINIRISELQSSSRNSLVLCLMLLIFYTYGLFPAAGKLFPYSSYSYRENRSEDEENLNKQGLKILFFRNLIKKNPLSSSIDIGRVDIREGGMGAASPPGAQPGTVSSRGAFPIPHPASSPSSTFSFSNLLGSAPSNKKYRIFWVTSKNWEGNLAESNHITSIGNIMYTNYNIWLIIASFILLLAMVGAIVITIKPTN